MLVGCFLLAVNLSIAAGGVSATSTDPRDNWLSSNGGGGVVCLAVTRQYQCPPTQCYLYRASRKYLCSFAVA